jgi:hypothetical protein
MKMKINLTNIKVAPTERDSEGCKKKRDYESYYELGKQKRGLKGKALCQR